MCCKINLYLAGNLDEPSVSVKTSHSNICPLQPQASITFFPSLSSKHHRGQAGSSEIQMVYVERMKIPCLRFRPDSALHFHAPCAHWVAHLVGSQLKVGSVPQFLRKGKKAGALFCAQGTELCQPKSWERAQIPSALSHTTHK